MTKNMDSYSTNTGLHFAFEKILGIHFLHSPGCYVIPRGVRRGSPFGEI